MTPSNTLKSLKTVFGAAALALPLLATAAPLDRATAKSYYDADARACLQSTTAGTTERSACLRDARSAYQTRLLRPLDDGSTASDWARNALQRCNVHTDPDSREGCVRMVQGEGIRVGSVPSGAVLVELTMVVEEPVVTGQAPSEEPES
jgi:hypothetical protein